MKPNKVINTILIITSVALAGYIFFHSLNRVDIAPSKNNHLTNSNKIKITKYKDIDSVKTTAIYYLDVMRQTRRSESATATKDILALCGIIICQFALLVSNLKKKSDNPSISVSC